MNLSGLLEGKAILVTGAGQNIGKHICVEAAKQGANIFLTDIDERRIQNVLSELRQYQVHAEGFLSDASKPGDTDSLVKTLQQTRIDILVNNVAYQSKISSSLELPLEEWEKAFRTNLLGPLHLTRHMARKMIETRTEGSIIFITSIHQKIIRRLPAYSSTKAALKMIIQELAVELAPSRIRVNGVAPGYVKENEEGETLPHRYAPLWNTSVHPSYIGRAVVYLSSDYFSKYTTGSVLTIDAGLSLHNFTFDPITRKP